MSYTVSPIVLLISEGDAGAFSWIQRNWPRLKELGYKHICFELCNDSTLDENLDLLKQSIKNQKDVISLIKQAKNLNNIPSDCFGMIKHFPFHLSKNFLLNQVKEQKISHTLIDFPKKTFFKVDTNNNIIGDQPIDLDKLKLPREKQMAKYICQTAKENDGGVITVIGSNHFTVHEQIKKLDPKNCKQYRYFAIDQYHDIALPEALAKEDKATLLKKRLETYQSNVNNKISKINAAKLLPHFEAIDFTDNTKQKETDEKILEIIQSGINPKKETVSNSSKNRLTDFDKVTFIKSMEKNLQTAEKANKADDHKIFLSGTIK